MPRSLIVLMLVVGFAVRDGQAQSVAPGAEFGGDVSATLGRSGVQWGPRLVANFDGRNSIQITASLQKLSRLEDFAQTKTELYRAAYRRLVYADGPIRILATLGGGFERTVIVVPATTFGDPPITFPASRGADVVPAVTTGAAIDFRLGPRAAIVLESSAIVADRLDVQFSGGLVVPLGSYRSQPDRLAQSVPWAGLETGQRAWVTAGDGREVDGEVIDRSAAALTLRTSSGAVSFTADAVRSIDTTDPIRNGTVLGALIGGLGAIVPAVFATYLGCGLEDECSVGEVLRINGLLLGMGTGIGAATGALADSLRDHRVPLYRRSVILAPVISPQQLGGRVVIRW